MKRIAGLLTALLVVSGCNTKPNAPLEPTPPAETVTSISDDEYHQIEERILSRIAELKDTYPSLRTMTSPRGHEYNVTWVLDDPTKPASKLNARRAVFGEDGYWFSLQFYRGQWQGAARFRPIEFGDLKLWFNYGHGGNTSVIAAVTTILREQNEAFCQTHPWQPPNQDLQATRQAAP
jgi:hypothetical protein